jgi:hypothetical protein
VVDRPRVPRDEPASGRAVEAEAPVAGSDDYHSAPAPTVSLSHSVAKLLLTRSPLHALYAHPRLTPEPPKVDDPTKANDEGAILHKLILGRGEDIQVVEADEWRTKAAREAAAAARAIQRVPVLAPRYRVLPRVAAAVSAQIREHPACEDFYGPGRSEATLLWRTGPLWMRALADRIPDHEGAPLFDLKTTGISAAPEDFTRTQAAFYSRGAAALLPGPKREFRFIAFETAPPYAISVLTVGESLMEIAEREIKRATIAWARGVSAGDWPGYTPDLIGVEAPVHLLAKMETLT